ncbi:hypothetical protein F2Q69_00015015 [Brassica cretica]|uniref:Uncharacterized protein n=1 Tax=Brassica cretica TaxID=69181 RepID=A0A8S9R2J7_BRACR|nr:hypothetical protein F2Q69_00015015 [Brassica cretica]
MLTLPMPWAGHAGEQGPGSSSLASSTVPELRPWSRRALRTTHLVPFPLANHLGALSHLRHSTPLVARVPFLLEGYSFSRSSEYLRKDVFLAMSSPSLFRTRVT